MLYIGVHHTLSEVISSSKEESVLFSQKKILKLDILGVCNYFVNPS